MLSIVLKFACVGIVSQLHTPISNKIDEANTTEFSAFSQSKLDKTKPNSEVIMTSKNPMDLLLQSFLAACRYVTLRYSLIF